MAGYPPIPYRASEPSQMETQLAVLATDPARAGAAMQLLPGAAAIRQDIGARANMEADRDAALAAITQQQNALNQRNEARLKTYALQQPGMTAAAMQTPELSDLFAGSPQSVTDLVNAGTAGAFRAQGAKTNLELQQGYDYGVKSGNVVPPDVVNAQLGYKTQTMLPESLRLQGMKDAAAAARQSADAGRLNIPQYQFVMDPQGNQRWTATHIPPGMDAEVAAEVTRRNLAENLPKVVTGADNTRTVTPPNIPSGGSGVMVQRKTGMPGSTVTFGRGATRDAASQLPPAQTEGPGAQTQVAATQPVPPGDPRGPDISHRQQLFELYVAKQKAAGRNPQDADRLLNGGKLGIGVDQRTGQYWITENGVPKEPLRAKR